MFNILIIFRLHRLLTVVAAVGADVVLLLTQFASSAKAHTWRSACQCRDAGQEKVSYVFLFVQSIYLLQSGWAAYLPTVLQELPG